MKQKLAIGLAVWLSAAVAIASAAEQGQAFPEHDLSVECERQARGIAIIREAVDQKSSLATLYNECLAREKAALIASKKLWDSLSDEDRAYCGPNTANYYGLKGCVEIRAQFNADRKAAEGDMEAEEKRE